MSALFQIPETTLPIVGEDARFPVRRIYCVGRNYAAHAREMGFDPDREPPFFFLKPADTIVQSGATIPYPRETQNYHYEIELVIAIGAHGRCVSTDEARGLILGYATGLDMTRRDLQIRAREMGRPWDMGKGFDQSAPCGPITRRDQAPGIDQSRIALTVNGASKQDSVIGALIWSVDEIIAELSRYVDLEPGDLIFTGTPEGVGPVVAGDVLHGTIDGLEPVDLMIG